MNKKDTLDKGREVDIVRFEGGDIGGLKKSALVLFTNDDRKVQFIVDKSILDALGGIEEDENKISTFNVVMAVISAMDARIDRTVIYSEGKDRPNRACIYLIDAEGEERILETVPDYAVVLTFRMGGTMKVTETVLNEKARSIFDERFRYLFTGDNPAMDILKHRTREDLEKTSLGDLKRFMAAALESEEYQIAAVLKQIMESRKDES